MTMISDEFIRRAPRRPSRSVRTGPLLAPAVGLLLAWMIIPLALTLWFSLQYYNLLDPLSAGFAGLDNYSYLITDDGLPAAILRTLVVLFSVLALSIGFGIVFALLFDVEFAGRGVARLLIIAPFFVMPTVTRAHLGRSC